jgi:uncharacterized protein
MRFGHILLRCFAALWLAFFCVDLAQAQQFPPLTGRVVDSANIIDPASEAALSAKLEAFETRTRRQFVVTTIGDLQGYDIADYGWRLGEKWGIGDKQRDDGIILIIAPNDRKVRIEVGYELEATVTDGLSGQIIRESITPAFKAGNYVAGINAGADRIIKQLELPPEEAAKLAAEANRKAKSSGKKEGSPGAMIFWLIIVFFFFILPMFSRGRGRQYRGSGVGPVIIWGGGGGFGGGGGSWGGGGGGFGGGGFGGGGGGFGGGGASGGW